MTREQFITHVESTQWELRRFLVALCCGDSQLADDIAQESYLKAYLGCEGFRDSARFGAWIFRIAYNTFIDSRRSRHLTAGYEEASAVPASDTADAGFGYQHLYAALNSLPAKERTSMLLHYMQGYPVKEIAAIVGVSEDAVKKHLSRGRSRLRNLLSDNE